MKRRQGFTLVELLVSMALIIFIMAILSQAFIAALNVFRDLKGQGDLAEKLRATTQILQHDLAADHFGSFRRLSDPTFWNNGPPSKGFFSVYHGSASTALGPIDFLEGADTNLIGSYRSIDHAMSFTVKLTGNNVGDFMSASAIGSGNVWNPPPLNTPVIPQLPSNNPGIPNGLGIGAIQAFGPPESRYQPLVGTPNVSGYNYQWASVAWYLKPQMNPSTVPPQQDATAADTLAGTAGFPLYTLYRRQVLLVPDNNLVALSTTPIGGVPSTLLGTNFLEMSCFPDPKTAMIYFNSPRDVTMPANRVLSWGGQPPYTPIPLGSQIYGSDIQLNDVVSFDIRLLPLYPGIPPTTPIPDPFITLWDAYFMTNFTYTSPPGITGRVFDTWSSFSNGINDYSGWNSMVPPTPGTTIPFWTTTPLTYQYPVGTTRLMSLPATGSGPIIRAVQVTIRIWDFKTNQTRQVTIVQAL